MEQTGEVSNSVLFAGYQYDKETGLYYLNARMYDPVTARFMQEDTFAGQQQDPLSLNLYTYCHNSPLMYFDPTGHYPQSIDGIQDEIDQLRKTGTHNAGLWSQINALEAAKERLIQQKEDARKKEGEKLTARYANINSFMKDHPEFAELDHVQSAMEAATYMGTYTYLSVMENNIANYTAYKPGDSFENWKNRQDLSDDRLSTERIYCPEQRNYYARQDEIDHRAEYSKQKKDTMSNYADDQIKKILEFNKANGVSETRLNNIKRELDEAKGIFTNDRNTYEDWEAFWFLASYVGTPYRDDQNYTPKYTVNHGYPKHKELDCSDLSFAFYLEYYGYSGMDDYTRDQINRGVPVYSPVFSGNKWSPKEGEELDFTKLKFGDLVLYDFSDRLTGEREGYPGHVGIFVGFNEKGVPQVIDSSSDKSIHMVQFRNLDCLSSSTISMNSICAVRRDPHL